MSQRYPTEAVRADYLRAGAGLGLTLFPFALTDPHILIALPCLALAAVFAVFGARTVQRHLTRVEMTEEGLLLHAPLGSALRWGEIGSVRLSYYSTRRDRKDGWMHLTVRGRTAAGRRRRIDVESTLDGFDAVAERAARAAVANGATLSDATKDNLTALGITIAARRGFTPR